MVDFEYKDLFYDAHVERKTKLAADDGSVTFVNSDIHMGQIEITESLCSEEQLVFGSCEASSLKFRISNNFIPLTGKWFTITVTIGGHTDAPLKIGHYKVNSDVPTADRSYRDLTAYDAMYDILFEDMTEWYNKVLPDKESRVPMREFRTKFVEYFGLEQVVPEGGLVNDDMIVERTVEPQQLSGRDIISAICEINGCFGHITRDGKFQYLVLDKNIQGLYPRNDLYPEDDLYPRDPRSAPIGKAAYKKCTYQDYLVKSINKVQIRQEENDIGAIYPNREPDEADNPYIVENNFLVYGKSAKELEDIARKLLGAISGIVYRPAEVVAVGNPCFEVGDAIRLNTKYELIETYIFERKLSGIQSSEDSYTANGNEKRTENINSLNTSIIQLKGKTNTLIRTVDETRLEMKDMEQGLTTEIQVTAGQIRAELTNEVAGLNNRITITASGLQGEITDTANQLSNQITVTASGLRGEIADTKNGLQTQITANASGLSAEITRATAEEGKLSNNIKITADGLNAEITRAKGEEGSLSTRISATAEGLSAEITRASAAEGSLSNRITANASGLSAEITRASTAEGKLSNSISVTANGLSAEITRAKGEESSLSTKLTATANGLSAEITRANSAEGTLSARITATADQISTKVSKGDLSSEISQEAGKITIKSNRFSLESTNCTITDTGKITAKDVELSGKITATSGYIGSSTKGFTITESSIYSGKNGIDANAKGIYIGMDGISLGPITKYWIKNSGSGYTYGSNPAFKVTSEGNVFIGLGSLTIGFGQTNVTTIGNGFIEVRNNPLSLQTNMTSIEEGKLTVTGSTNTGYGSAEFSCKGINVTGSQTFSISSRNGIIMGASGGKISFLGATPVAKQTVSTVADASVIGQKLNAVINALKNYGLL